MLCVVAVVVVFPAIKAQPLRRLFVNYLMLRLNFPAQLQLQFLASASACGAGQHFWASPESCL